MLFFSLPLNPRCESYGSKSTRGLPHYRLPDLSAGIQTQHRELQKLSGPKGALDYRHLHESSVGIRNQTAEKLGSDLDAPIMSFHARPRPAMAVIYLQVPFSLGEILSSDDSLE
jgi:hypothetical protein